jgi:hypothetical protein
VSGMTRLRWGSVGRFARLLVVLAGVAVATAVVAAGSKDAPEKVGEPAASPAKKTKPALKSASGPDLAVTLQGPAQAKAGESLPTIRAVVKNASKSESDKYRVEIELRTVGVRDRGKPLASQSGSTLGPGARRTHSFPGARVPAVGR